jgi:hypothetical protein
VTTTPWIDNVELFSKRLAVGHRYALNVGAALLATGHAVTVTPSTLRASRENIEAYRDELDVLVTRPDGKQFIVESKSRNVEFGNDPASYPYDTAFVDTVRSWTQKTRQRGAVVLTSQRTKAMLVVPVSSQPKWLQETKYDRARGLTDTWYMAPREELRTMDELVSWLANVWWAP